MGGKLHPAVAQLRVAVRECFKQQRVRAGQTVTIALSGGADSLALTAAAVFVAAKLDARISCAIVDHGLQPNSAAVAAAAAACAARLGATPTVLPVTVTAAGTGPEAAARTARYAALAAHCEAVGSRLLLTGHTRDDQAEQVLLALVRGSGLTALSGISPARPLPGSGGRVMLCRPLLECSRQMTEAACEAAGLAYWSDPHNTDARFLRSRVRQTVLPFLTAQLGPGVSANLARTAQLAAADNAALAELAACEFERLAVVQRGQAGQVQRVRMPVSELAGQPAAITSRIIRMAGAQLRASYTEYHTSQVLRLVTAWHGQRPLELPASRVWREAGELIFAKPDTMNAQ